MMMMRSRYLMCCLAMAFYTASASSWTAETNLMKSARTGRNLQSCQEIAENGGNVTSNFVEVPYLFDILTILHPVEAGQAVCNSMEEYVIETLLLDDCVDDAGGARVLEETDEVIGISTTQIDVLDENCTSIDPESDDNRACYRIKCSILAYVDDNTTIDEEALSAELVTLLATGFTEKSFETEPTDSVTQVMVGSEAVKNSMKTEPESTTDGNDENDDDDSGLLTIPVIVFLGLIALCLIAFCLYLAHDACTGRRAGRKRGKGAKGKNSRNPDIIMVGYSSDESSEDGLGRGKKQTKATDDLSVDMSVEKEGNTAKTTKWICCT